MVTPMLVASQAPNPWALFGYLAIVLAATGVIARMRDWTLLMAAAFVGTGIWTILYMTTRRVRTSPPSCSSTPYAGRAGLRLARPSRRRSGTSQGFRLAAIDAQAAAGNRRR